MKTIPQLSDRERNRERERNRGRTRGNGKTAFSNCILIILLFFLVTPDKRKPATRSRIYTAAISGQGPREFVFIALLEAGERGGFRDKSSLTRIGSLRSPVTQRLYTFLACPRYRLVKSSESANLRQDLRFPSPEDAP